MAERKSHKINETPDVLHLYKYFGMKKVTLTMRETNIQMIHWAQKPDIYSTVSSASPLWCELHTLGSATLIQIEQNSTSFFCSIKA